ncbi:hypothetical protein [Streptomyces sp. NPDC020951]|uniref:hypothetical protein n=1 Tax=Streptomyces sp. NPDC020951 TaxID=3365104 RepID=UPI00378C6B1A
MTGTGDGLADAGTDGEAERDGEAGGVADADGEGVGGFAGDEGDAVAVARAVSVGFVVSPPSPGEQPTRASTPAAHTIAELRASTAHSPRVDA